MSNDMLGIIVRKLVTMSEGTLGSVYDLLEKLSSDPEWVTAFKKFLRKEDPWPGRKGEEIPAPVSAPARAWHEENGVIRFSVTSDGTTGEGWITRLEGAEKSVSKYAKSILGSADFVPSPAGTAYEIVILKGSLFEENARTTVNIRVEANRRGLKKPNAEVACLISAQFTDDEIKAMGLWWIVTMHKPIKDSDGDPRLLSADRDGSGHSLNAYYDYPGRRWDREDGFAFLQV